MSPSSKKPRLAEALQKDVDLHGGDVSLAMSVAEMTESAKQQSRANLRDFAAELRANLHRVPPDDDAEAV